jgi:hypothetical protein
MTAVIMLSHLVLVEIVFQSGFWGFTQGDKRIQRIPNPRETTTMASMS